MNEKCEHKIGMSQLGDQIRFRCCECKKWFGVSEVIDYLYHSSRESWGRDYWKKLEYEIAKTRRLRKSGVVLEGCLIP